MRGLGDYWTQTTTSLKTVNDVHMYALCIAHLVSVLVYKGTSKYWDKLFVHCRCLPFFFCIYSKVALLVHQKVAFMYIIVVYLCCVLYFVWPLSDIPLHLYMHLHVRTCVHANTCYCASIPSSLYRASLHSGYPV